MPVRNPKSIPRSARLRIQCHICGKMVNRTRSDVITCSPRCRQRYKRHCDRITAMADAARRHERSPSERAAGVV